jgi:hypothetical protein
MCTVSWLRSAGGYELFCNRDERHTRKLARPPGVRAARGVQFIAPTDGDHGGAWLGVNQFGLTLNLLNRYDDLQPGGGRDYRSRGLLLNSLLDCQSLAEFAARIVRAQLARYRPFTLLALLPGEPAMLAHWDGRLRSIEHFAEAARPLVSSAYRPLAVAAARRQLFWRMAAAAGRLTPELCHDFHHSHAPERGPLSVCMHRADAATVSFSHIKVTERMIEFAYRGQAPCVEHDLSRVVLARTVEPWPLMRRAAGGGQRAHVARTSAPRLSFI